MKKNVGKITEKEKDEMVKVHEKKEALKELFLSLAFNCLSQEIAQPIYKKIVQDLVVANEVFDQKWYDLADSYNWDILVYTNWMIDFATNNVYLEITES